MVNIFETGIEPIRKELKFQNEISNLTLPNIPYGYLTFCYQISDQYTLKLSLSYVNNHVSLDNEQEKSIWNEKYSQIKHPNSILVLTSWIPTITTGLNSIKSGVLKIDRLCLLDPNQTTTTSSPLSLPLSFIPGFIPSIALFGCWIISK